MDPSAYSAAIRRLPPSPLFVVSVARLFTMRIHTSRRLALLASATLVVVLACASGSKTATGPGNGATPANIVKISGDSQSGAYEATLPKPLVVKVTDASGNAVTGGSVAWLISLDGAPQTLSITTTDGSGQAQLTPTMGGIPGAFAVTAGINNHSVTFTGISNITLASGAGQLSAGLFANCGLTTQGVAFCWGNGFGGELGNGSNGPHTGPVPVSGGYTFKQINVATFVACGLTTGGTLYCWGDPVNGAFGNGTAPGGSLALTPVAAGGGLTFSLVAIGDAQSCGLSGGVTYCWGPNGAGQLGTGDTVHHWSPVTVAVPSGVSFVSLTAGSSFNCGLTSAGAAYCWGSNGNGQLGIGTSSPTYKTAPTAVSGGHAFTSISAGPTEVCGLTAAGTVYCWGSGAHGNGTSGIEYTPTAIQQTGLTFASMLVNGQHACALTTSGAAYCWGDNYQGDLGSGSFSTSGSTPVAVTGGLTFRAIAVGGLHDCGYTPSNVMYCWGSNTSQQLGLAATADTMYAVPVPVPGMNGGP